MITDAFCKLLQFSKLGELEKYAETLASYNGYKIVIDREKTSHFNSHIHFESKGRRLCAYDIIRKLFVGKYSFLSAKEQLAIKAFCEANKTVLDTWFHSDQNTKPALVAPLSTFLPGATK